MLFYRISYYVYSRTSKGRLCGGCVCVTIWRGVCYLCSISPDLSLYLPGARIRDKNNIEQIALVRAPITSHPHHSNRPRSNIRLPVVGSNRSLIPLGTVTHCRLLGPEVDHKYPPGDTGHIMLRPSIPTNNSLQQGELCTPGSRSWKGGKYWGSINQL